MSCHFITQKGTRCTRKIYGDTFCNQHYRSLNRMDLLFGSDTPDELLAKYQSTLKIAEVKEIKEINFNDLVDKALDYNRNSVEKECRLFIIDVGKYVFDYINENKISDISTLNSFVKLNLSDDPETYELTKYKSKVKLEKNDNTFFKYTDSENTYFMKSVENLVGYIIEINFIHYKTSRTMSYSDINRFIRWYPKIHKFLDHLYVPIKYDIRTSYLSDEDSLCGPEKRQFPMTQIETIFSNENINLSEDVVRFIQTYIYVMFNRDAYYEERKDFYGTVLILEFFKLCWLPKMLPYFKQKTGKIHYKTATDIILKYDIYRNKREEKNERIYSRIKKYLLKDIVNYIFKGYVITK
jgi:hypothetical protein